jgi:hypothetical protein
MQEVFLKAAATDSPPFVAVNKRTVGAWHYAKPPATHHEPSSKRARRLTTIAEQLQ